ncbi:MAG: ATP-binding protein, partial [Bacteroidota bacterium]
ERKSLVLVRHFKFEPGQEGSLSNDYLNCLYLQNPDTLWIGTENGINVLDIPSGKMQHFSEEDGVPKKWIQSIVADSKGHVWAGTQSGLCEISLGPSGPEITSYDVFDGLRNEFFSAQSAGYSKAGELIFGTVSGLGIFHPDDIRFNNLPPKVALNELRIFNRKVPIGPMSDGESILQKSIGETQEISLNHQQNVFSLGFVGLHTGESENISYAYKLEGFNQDWVYTETNNRQAHYTNLPYRSFTFMVKAGNSDGVWSEPVKLKINILPPFWRTYWAYILYALLFISLLYGVRKLTQLRAEYRHNLQLERVEREKLEEVTHMKQQFFTNISHELRTPLTLIISPLEQLIKDRNYDRSLYRSFQRMNLNANRLLTMINQLLDIQKTESGLMRLRVGKGNLSKFVGEVVLAFQGLAEQNKISLSFKPEAPNIEAFYDRDQLEKVLFNLLSNALKFTPSGGEVKVSLCTQNLSDPKALEGFVLLQVSDTGMGIAHEQLEHIFDRFYQAESKFESHRSGTGIGLSLSKSIVEAHHGQIWVKSKIDAGSSFFVSLPLGEAHFAKSEKIEAFEDSESLRQYVQLPLEAALVTTQREQKAKPDRRLLLIEDNADIRLYLRENLQAEYEVFEAANGKEGLALALEHIPDLVVADIAMPEMDGISLCRELKSRVETSHIPVILLTARTSLIFKIDGLETGADDYITKPFNLRLLRVRINNLIESRRKLRQKFGENWEIASQDAVLNRLDEQFLADAQQAISERMDDPQFSVELLAEALNLSRMQLYRKLKALTDHSPNKLIRTVRLRQAAKLLKSKQYNVSEITYMVGYNDLKSFREQFKKEYGVSPSIYSAS